MVETAQIGDNKDRLHANKSSKKITHSQAVTTCGLSSLASFLKILSSKRVCCVFRDIRHKNAVNQYQINSQSLEDTQVGYILQKYTLAPKSFFIKDDCCTVMSRAVEIQKYSFAKIHFGIMNKKVQECK